MSGHGSPKDKDGERAFYPFPKFCSYNISIRKVSCGASHACFITNSNFLYAMGSNSHGQLGIGDPVRGKNSPILVEDLPQGRQITDLNCGGNSSILCLEDGSVYSWGEGRHGALG